MIDSSSGTFTVTSPGMSASASGHQGMGAAGISFDVKVASVQVNLSGTTKSSILIGQGCRATLDAGGYTVSNYQWLVSGKTFGRFITEDNDGTAHQGYVLPGPDTTVAAPHWFWQRDGEQSVSCSATVTFPDNTTANVTARRDVSVVAPRADVRYANPMGSVRLRADGLFALMGDASPPYQDGMNYQAWANTPELFAVGGNYGMIGFAQLATDNCSWTDSAGVTHAFNRNGVYGLDDGGRGSFIAYGALRPATGDPSLDTFDHKTGTWTGSWLHGSDSPAVNVSMLPNAISVTRSFSATTWVMYTPPGYDVSDVPLWSFGWGFDGEASGPAKQNGIFDQSWTVTSSHTNYDNSPAWLPEFPQWSRVLSELTGYTPP